MAIVTGAAFLLRLGHILQSDFPLNDGGMFAAAVDDLRANSWRLPAFVSYNDVNIPYAYPPLGFYAAGWVSSLGVTTTNSLRIVPLLASTATVPAFYLLARRTVPGEAAVVSVAAFAIMPRSFNWEIAGGGLTRSLGLLFAVLALHQLARLRDDRPRGAVALAGLFGALTALSHLEMAWFVLYSGALFLAAGHRSRSHVLAFIASGAIASALALVWLLPVLIRHGASTYLSAARTGNTASVAGIQIFAPSPLDEPFLPLLWALALVGVLWCIGKRQWLLPLWVVVIYVLDARKGDTLVTLPAAMLATLALLNVCAPLLARQPTGTSSSFRQSLSSRVLVYAVFGFGLAGAALAGFADRSPLRAASKENRDAMSWVAEQTPPESRFLVVSGQRWWSIDVTSEWFPYLADRQSVATVQGFEWLGASRFRDRAEAFRDIQECQSLDCLRSSSFPGRRLPDYVYVARHQFEGRAADDTECCSGLRAQLAASPDFELVFENGGASIYRWLPARPAGTH